MASYNRVILLGNLTRDPELRYIPNGTPVTDIGLAVNNRRKGANGEWTDEPVFVDITLFGREAEIACEYLKKGSPTLIEGRLKLDSWEKDGQKFNKLKVVGEKLQLLGGRGDSSRGGGYSQGGSSYSQQGTAPAPSQRPSQQQSPQDSYYDTGGGDDVPF
ncbi:MAG TPA: single-stranded DNA-binding protein [Planctomycetaceae bacterium]|nr:single-stranded DNA-binding protein [Planctomycetaceae bacterium]